MKISIALLQGEPWASSPPAVMTYTPRVTVIWANKVPEWGQGMMGPGHMMPHMDGAPGRKLFASRGCVVCHSVNGVGGEDAPALNVSTMAMPMGPFEFAVKMWRGAEATVVLQREELGEPIELTGQAPADIIAFIHYEDEQKCSREPTFRHGSGS